MGGGHDIGTVLGGSYRLERVIGTGGMGTVYEAVHTRLPRRFAVKLLSADVTDKEDLFERFRREAEIASAAGHENIIEAYDFNTTDEGVPYIVMELLAGESLRDRLERAAPLGLQETAGIIDQVASALCVAHARGIVHRDLKPENVFLCRRGGRDDFVKVLDFGVSKLLHSQSISTQTGTLLGTPHYMAPEQASTIHGNIDQRTDVFALGAIMYECLAGHFAFEGPTPVGVIYNVVHSSPTPLRERRTDIPEAVERLIARAMSKRPDRRHDSCGEFQRELRQVRELSSLATLQSGAAPSPTPLTTDRPNVLVVRPSRRPETETLGQASVAKSSLAEPTPKYARGALWAGAATAAVAIAIAALVVNRSNGEEQISDELSAGSTAPAASEAKQVRLALRIVPASARVEVDGVTTHGDALVLPRSQELHELVVSAQGYESERRQFRAHTDGELIVELKTVPDVSGLAQTPTVKPELMRREPRSTSKRTRPAPSSPPARPAAAPSTPPKSLGPVERSL
jgi:serine/threonine protein kinase